MIENEEYENELSQAAHAITNRAHEIAAAAGVTLIACEWNRGHEVADLDEFWLTLESDKDATTQHFPNEWLEIPGTPDKSQRISALLISMVRTLAPASQVNQR